MNPKNNCTRCHGRGIIGTRIAWADRTPTGSFVGILVPPIDKRPPVACSCVKPRLTNGNVDHAGIAAGKKLAA